jgi:hypothetical protein
LWSYTIDVKQDFEVNGKAAEVVLGIEMKSVVNELDDNSQLRIPIALLY